MINRLNTRFTRAKDIYKREGLVILIKATFAFLISCLSYGKYSFYVYEILVEKRNVADYMPEIKDITVKIVETKQQLDELLNDGFELSLLDIPQAHYRLEKGAIALLIFVECELAYRLWSAMTEEAKNTFNRWPYKVDFMNNEACDGEAWTNPKYRRQGINTYADYKLEEFLLGKGIRKMWRITLTNNIPIHKVHDKREGSRIYAKADYFRIGRMQFWKETPIEST